MICLILAIVAVFIAYAYLKPKPHNNSKFDQDWYDKVNDL